MTLQRDEIGEHTNLTNYPDNFQYPPSLREFLKFITIGWLHKALQETSLVGETMTWTKKQFAMGCSGRYKSYGALWSHRRHYKVQGSWHHLNKRYMMDLVASATFKG